MRLAKLLRQENEKLSEINVELDGSSEYAKYATQENDSSGLKEKRAERKKDKAYEKYSKLLETKKDLQRKIGYSNLYQLVGVTFGNKTFRTQEYKGETLYMIGAKPVDKETYEAEFTKAKQSTGV